MPKILVTGTNSFVGRNFIKYSKFREVEEISLFDNKPESINFGKYDIVIHLVAIVHHKKRIDLNKYMSINRDLCMQVAETAKKAGVRQFIFLSSVKVYGKFVIGSETWNESSVCHPDDSYGISKYEAELALKDIADENFIISIVRTPLVYGEGVKANMLSIMNIIYRFKILPFKSIQNKRNFTSAQNLVAFIDRIIEKNAPGIFIAMDEKPLSTTDLVIMISQSMDKKVILFKLPDLIIRAGIKLVPGIFDRLYGSFEMENTETLTSLDFHPPVASKEGIDIMVKHYLNTK